MIMDDLAVIRDGLADTTTFITTDLVPAIDGMPLKPVVNAELTARINMLDVRN